MIGHLDCSTGVSGDKFLGAILQAGERTGKFTRDDLSALLASLAPEGRVVVEDFRSHGIASLSVTVEAAEQPPSRNWPQVREMIERAALGDVVRENALAVFTELAHAEAQAHGAPFDKVHFHEVGALDSIMDVVGVCAGLDALGVDRLIATAPAVGWGTVATSHGILPVPAPATAILLMELPVIPGPSRADGSEPGELTTPTGAALIRVLVDGFGPMPPSLPTAIGYGAGTRDIGVANVCRLIVAEEAPRPEVVLHPEEIALLETNVDHISPEASAVAAEQLLAEGALDVWMTPIVMKKGRAAVTLSVLCEAGRAEHFSARIVALTGSLGVRSRRLERFVAEREIVELETQYGTVRYKSGAGRRRPEADDVARVAREQGRSFTEVEQELNDLLG